MNKKLILKRLWDTIEMIQQLEDKEFKYKNYVTRSNKEGCGTVCCVAGWYPKYFPDAGLIWRKGNLRPKNIWAFTNEELIIYHGLNSDITDVLFYGGGIHYQPLLTKTGKQVWCSIEKKWENFISFSNNPPHFSAKEGIKSSKDQVQNLFEFIYYLIDNNYIKNYRHGGKD